MSALRPTQKSTEPPMRRLVRQAEGIYRTPAVQAAIAANNMDALVVALPSCGIRDQMVALLSGGTNTAAAAA